MKPFLRPMDVKTVRPNDHLGVIGYDVVLGDQRVAYVFLRVIDEGKTLYIEDVQALVARGKWDLGTPLVRALLREIRANHPDVTAISGLRISGAREVDELVTIRVK